MSLVVYVNYTLEAGTQDFMKLTDNIPEKFESNPREFTPIIFAEAMINPYPDGYFLEQNVNPDKIKILPEDFSIGLFWATSHRLSWIVKTRHEIFVGVNRLSQVKRNICQGRYKVYKRSNKTYKKISLSSTKISQPG